MPHRAAESRMVNVEKLAIRGQRVAGHYPGWDIGSRCAWGYWQGAQRCSRPPVQWASQAGAATGFWLARVMGGGPRPCCPAAHHHRHACHLQSVLAVRAVLHGLPPRSHRRHRLCGGGQGGQRRAAGGPRLPCLCSRLPPRCLPVCPCSHAAAPRPSCPCAAHGRSLPPA